MGVFVSSRQVRMGINLMTPWWLSGASVDLDFDNGRYYDASLGNSAPLAPLNSYLSISRASTGYAQDSGGNWVAFGNDTLRITDKGLLVEDTRTNYLLNSGTPATQTTASLSTGSYTLWVEGSGSATPSAGSATITGAGPATAGTPDTFSVTVAGTVTVTVSGSLTRFQLEAGAFASSYIPTAGASVTRAKDLISVLGNAKTIINTLPQTIVLDGMTIVSPAIMGDFISIICGVGGGATTYPAFQGLNSNTIAIWNSISHGNLTSNAFGGGATWSSGVKVAMAQDSGGYSIVGGGGTVATSGTVQEVWPSTVYFGSNAAGSPLSFNGYARRLTLWNSKLADATLQSLTAP